MDQYCTGCGTQLSGESVCPQCGKAVTTEPVVLMSEFESSPQPPKKKFRVKWWMILIAAVAAAVLIGAFWGQIALWLMPEATLTAAAAKTGADLAERLEGSPLSVLARTAQWESERTTDISFNLSMGIFGDISANMTMIRDEEKQASAALTDLSMMGLSYSAGTYYTPDRVVYGVDGQFYGVDFATLEEDLRTNPAFADLEQASINEFIIYLEELRKSAVSQQRAEQSGEAYLQLLMDFAKDLELTPGSRTFSVDGTRRRCGTLTVRLDQAELAAFLEGFAGVMENDEAKAEAMGAQEMLSSVFSEEGSDELAWDGMIGKIRDQAAKIRSDADFRVSVVFYIYRDYLTGIGIEMQRADQESVELEVSFGSDVSTGDITLRGKTSSQGETSEYDCTLSLIRGENTYAEQLLISAGEDTAVSYVWDKASGDLNIKFSENSAAKGLDYTAILTEDGECITLDMPDLGSLMEAGESTQEDEMAALLQLADMDMKVTIRKGAVIDIPDYIPLSQWTLDDWMNFNP